MEIKVLASGSAGNCYLINDGETPLLLEAGLPFRAIQRGLGFGVAGLAACLISHEHGDHAQAAADIMKAGVDVFASRGTAKALGLKGHRLGLIRSMEKLSIGTWTVTPFDVVHDAEEPLGFILASKAGKLFFASDTAYVKYRVPGLTHIMIEVNYVAETLRENMKKGLIHPAHYKRVLRNHMSLERAAKFLQANDLNNVQEIWALHLSDANADEALIQTTLQRVSGKPVYIAPRG